MRRGGKAAGERESGRVPGLRSWRARAFLSHASDGAIRIAARVTAVVREAATVGARAVANEFAWEAHVR